MSKLNTRKSVITTKDRQGNPIAFNALDLMVEAVVRISEARPIEKPSLGYGRGTQDQPFNSIGTVHFVDEPSGAYDPNRPESGHAARVQIGRIVDNFQNGKFVGPLRFVPVLHPRGSGSMFVTKAYGDGVARLYSQSLGRDYDAELQAGLTRDKAAAEALMGGRTIE